MEQGLQQQVYAETAAEFLKREDDRVADGMTNKFLQGVLWDSDRLKQRLSILEQVQLATAEAKSESGSVGKRSNRSKTSEVDMKAKTKEPAEGEASFEEKENTIEE